MTSVPPLTFVYRNHRGVTDRRRVRPLRVEYKTSEWHVGEQWILVAYDLDKQAERDFAMIDIIDLSPDGQRTQS
ncbi:putative DNA-binding transcriptional regulator YafY [Devosia subaequoris]|uniref:Putative DNA-binding transcriptional regulator YafY n=1 Tax=Devosia subaequoris TaxID=395930 RepID=A0A7W6NAT6_9HYPH|nr:putative DNA-binding transcriptional regulator YafY [Devosia subaequoris]